ncbi:MAG: hypothetical protein IKG42_04280 [Clostridia bacterium]|nr:hypothetical protein [Clostridia bacterium]
MAKIFIDKITYVKSKTEVRYGGNHDENGAKTFYSNDQYHIDGLPAQVKLTVSDENGRKITFDIREQILEYYGKKRISEKMVERFKRDLNMGNVSLSIENGNVIIS